MRVRADIIEIFSSIQGEGPRVDEHHLFVRFQGCSLRCQFCDTPTSFIINENCRVETQAFSNQFEHYPNPISTDQLNDLLAPFSSVQALALTGGEPLEQNGFLQAWLPQLKRPYPTLLETAGVHPTLLEPLLPWIDIIGMDIKLPSVTAMRPYWEEHRHFLSLAREKELYIKVVVSNETDPSELSRAIDIVAEAAPQSPFILQPASPVAQFRSAPSARQLKQWKQEAQERLADVRIIPQLHKQLQVL